jgi:biopolymer transport protein ExbD
MRRFSQRNSLVTLSDLNVTPLIDLAFVLLIIFMITTPLLEQGLSLDLPNGGQPDKALKKEDVRTVEVDKNGSYMLDGKTMALDQIEQKLVDDHQKNQNLLVYIRADNAGSYGSVVAILNRCKQNDITRVSLRTEPD